MGARRYSASTGRFLQRDTYDGAVANLGLAEDALTGNRYALAAGNPITFIELDGHFATDPNGKDGGGSACRAVNPVTFIEVDGHFNEVDDTVGSGYSAQAWAIKAANDAEDLRDFYRDAATCDKREERAGECKPLLSKVGGNTLVNMGQTAAALACRAARDPRVMVACVTIVGGKNLAIDLAQCFVKPSAGTCGAALYSALAYYCKMPVSKNPAGSAVCELITPTKPGKQGSASKKSTRKKVSGAQR